MAVYSDYAFELYGFNRHLELHPKFPKFDKELQLCGVHDVECNESVYGSRYQRMMENAAGNLIIGIIRAALDFGFSYPLVHEGRKYDNKSKIYLMSWYSVMYYFSYLSTCGYRYMKVI